MRNHFSARDIVSGWDVVEVHERATSLAAAHFLDTLLDRMPFAIAALQVDGGSEFAAEFEQACQQRGLPLFVLPPRSPKLNGHVERATAPTTRNFTKSRRTAGRCPNSIANCGLGRTPTTRFVRIKRSVMPRQWSSSSAGDLTKESRVSLIMWTSTHT